MGDDKGWGGGEEREGGIGGEVGGWVSRRVEGERGAPSRGKHAFGCGCTSRDTA